MFNTITFVRDQVVDVDNAGILVDESRMLLAMENPCKIVTPLVSGDYVVRDRRGLWRNLPGHVMQLHIEPRVEAKGKKK